MNTIPDSRGLSANFTTGIAALQSGCSYNYRAHYIRVDGARQ
jgi:hypothetical protein